VPAFVEAVVVNKLWVGSLCPAPRSLNDLVGEGAHRDRDGHVFRCKERELVLPINTRRRDRRVRQPVQRDVVEDVVSRKSLRLTVEDVAAYDVYIWDQCFTMEQSLRID
jgi:hypothetical protein